jgi:hypothetical protein
MFWEMFLAATLANVVYLIVVVLANAVSGAERVREVVVEKIVEKPCSLVHFPIPQKPFEPDIIRSRLTELMKNIPDNASWVDMADEIGLYRKANHQ